MTNPTAAMRMLITYAICIPVAIVVGYLLTNPLDYGTLGFLGLLIAVIISPVFIKWYYPLTVFGLAYPMICFFLPGKPPFMQVMVIIAVLVVMTERILTSGKRSVSTPVMTWPLLFIIAVTYMTAELNGGVGLHSLGGDSGGGRKYIDIFIGCGVYFVLASQAIPKQKRNLYLMLFMLPGLLGMISNFFPFLPSPLNKINLLFPPTSLFEEGVTIGTTRLTSFSFAIGTIMCFMLAKYGLSGIFSARHPGRGVFFIASFLLSMLGGFRSSLGGTVMTLTLMFFIEGLHRSRLVPAILLVGVLGAAVLVTCSDKLPFTFQRSMSFLPLKWDYEVIQDAEGSSEWRYRIWRATWPKVPEHLLLGKGYTISKEDYDMMGSGTFVYYTASHINEDSDPLVFSGDYHSGPLSVLMPFGLWGGIAVLWLFGASLYVLYQNYRYGDPELRTLNIYFLVTCISSIIAFFFIFGSYKDTMSTYGGMAAFSLAMNGGLCKRPARAAANQRIKPISAGIPQPA
jgi:hypothetical protein